MYEYRAKVLKIIDGDTVDIDLGFSTWIKNERVRIRQYGHRMNVQ